MGKAASDIPQFWVFITTSDFSSEAVVCAKQMATTIFTLLPGKIDSDFFDVEGRSRPSFPLP